MNYRTSDRSQMNRIFEKHTLAVFIPGTDSVTVTQSPSPRSAGLRLRRTHHDVDLIGPHRLLITHNLRGCMLSCWQLDAYRIIGRCETEVDRNVSAGSLPKILEKECWLDEELADRQFPYERFGKRFRSLIQQPAAPLPILLAESFVREATRPGDFLKCFGNPSTRTGSLGTRKGISVPQNQSLDDVLSIATGAICRLCKSQRTPDAFACGDEWVSFYER